MADLTERLDVALKLSKALTDAVRTGAVPVIAEALNNAEALGVAKERRRCLEVIQTKVNAAIDEGESSMLWGRLSEIKALILDGK